jgi:hypothetical protein
MRGRDVIYRMTYRTLIAQGLLKTGPVRPASIVHAARIRALLADR